MSTNRGNEVINDVAVVNVDCRQQEDGEDGVGDGEACDEGGEEGKVPAHQLNGLLRQLKNAHILLKPVETKIPITHPVDSQQQISLLFGQFLQLLTCLEFKTPPWRMQISATTCRMTVGFEETQKLLHNSTLLHRTHENRLELRDSLVGRLQLELPLRWSLTRLRFSSLGV